VGDVKRLTILLLILLGIILVTGCSNNEDVAQVDPEDEEDELNVEEEPEGDVFENYFPLTGIGTNDEVDHRPIAITINNESQARPQTGLNEADMIYEILAEGNITRFVAFFHSQVPEDSIGPVRSARPYMIDISNGYNAFFVTHGWSPAADVMLSREKKADYLQGLYHDGSLFKRYSGRKAPHNSYITYENAVKGMEDAGYKTKDNLERLSFLEEDATVNGDIANKIMIKYYDNYKVAYEFDQEKNKYFRSSGRDGDVETKDYITGEPVGAENIFIVETGHRVLDDVGRREIDLTSGGKGYLIQNGVMQKVEWKSINNRILPYKDGELVKLVLGQTWVNIIPSNPGLEQNVIIE
jgi:hypothetical protein